MLNVRSAQIINTYGIGQIVNFPGDVSVMVCGLDHWEQQIREREDQAGEAAIDRLALILRESRLEKLLHVNKFYKPFPYMEGARVNNRLHIPAVRFPGWHYCSRRKCGRMFEVPLAQADPDINCPEPGCNGIMLPVRWVAVCRHGHIQDVPFREWVHNGPVPDGNDHNLYYRPGSGSGDLGSIFIHCSCGVRRSLAGLMYTWEQDGNISSSALGRIGLDRDTEIENITPDTNPAGQFCRGHRPWLGPSGIEKPVECAGHLQVLLRGGSNVHYANQISAIWLPPAGESANQYVIRVMDRISRDKLSGYMNHDNDGTILRVVLSNQDEVRNGIISADDLFDGIVAALDEKPDIEIGEINTEKDIKFEEYQTILHGFNSESSDFKAIRKTFQEYDKRELLEEYFECAVLIEKLKETRVFTGFSRINPANRIQKSDLSNNEITWLPATVVFGEGIFLKFRDDKINEWRNNNFKNIITQFHKAARRRNPAYADRDIDSAFILLHTFAHLLIKRLCFDCGYGSSSLRERIYYSSDQDDRMNGILIYTSSGDSEGSLGGLISQARPGRLGRIIAEAIEEARWCSADPVCTEVGRNAGQGPDSVNGAACHNCCLLPETCCEEFNMLLDRNAVVTLNNNSPGYFE
ncbi:MAG: DrmB family protein [Candidatus Kapaibacterium sp.]